MSAVLSLYQFATRLFSPLIAGAERMRSRRLDFPAGRAPERLGRANLVRPDGLLVWINAVSVGETQSVLPVIEALCEREIPVLLTTTTTSSAKLASARLPPGAIHQFAPIDLRRPVQRFYEHWHPDLYVCVESELWPRQIAEAQRRSIPLVLLNARLSQSSLRNWSRAPAAAAKIFGAFSAVFAQSKLQAEAIDQLRPGHEAVVITGDLKASAPPLPVDQTERERLIAIIASRSVWAAVSTHSGEEEIIAAAHRELDDGSLLILAPRHPARGSALANELRRDGWRIAQRSAGEDPDDATQIYLADTLGEIGLWYSLAGFACIGGSIVDRGGHNPFEAAHFATPVICGPYRSNFRQAYSEMERHGAAVALAEASPHALAEQIRAMAGNLHQMRSAMSSFPLGDPKAPVQIANTLADLMEGRTP